MVTVILHHRSTLKVHCISGCISVLKFTGFQSCVIACLTIRLSSEFSKQINLFSHVVTWFEMSKQELKMTAQVFASDDIL